MPGQRLIAVTLALLLAMPAARAGSSFPEDCGCAWQQEYKSLHTAIRQGGHTQRYTAVSYHDIGEVLEPQMEHTVSLLSLCADDKLICVRAGLSDLT